MKASPLIANLNAGEWSPELAGRVDLAKYPNSAKLLRNFIPTVQGPLVRRGGTKYVAAVKDSTDRTWLVPFEYSATQAWILEFGDLYVRFYTEHGVVESSPGVPYEIVSPYAAADLTNDDGTFALKIVQSGDVLYIANQKRTYAPRTLTRSGATSWAFATYQPDQGPLLELNSTTTTIYASGSTGSVTLEASANIFAATDVGRLVYLAVQNLDVKPWEVDKAYSTNDLVRSDGKTYKALNSATSGTWPPVHEQGNAYDGQTGVQWAYQDAGYGIARITAYTDANTVTASVVTDTESGLNQLPANVVGSGNATKRWKLGAWSATTEYPASVTFWRDRLWWAGRQRIWASVPNDFDNLAADFFGETGFDNAIWATLQAEDVSDILWISGGDKLAIGTPGGEFIGSEITQADPLGPANFKITRQSKRRCRSVQPVAVGNALLYVQRAGRRLLSFQYQLQSDTFESSDLSVLAPRLTRSGITSVAFAAEPHSVMWAALTDGKLVGLTLEQEQEVTGWHPHSLGGSGLVESIAVIPAPDGLRDELWMIVRRTIGGATARYVEYMTAPWQGPDNDGTGGDDQADAFYVDSGLTYDGAAATTISGLDHLEGETVSILADGAPVPDQVVASGDITLDTAASVVHVGLPCPARYVSPDIEVGTYGGTTAGKVGRIYRATIRFIDTLGGQVGRPNTDVSTTGTLDPIEVRVPADDMDDAPPIYSGLVDVTFPGDWEREKRIEVLADQPLPMTIAAILPRMHVNDR